MNIGEAVLVIPADRRRTLAVCEKAKGCADGDPRKKLCEERRQVVDE